MIRIDWTPHTPELIDQIHASLKRGDKELFAEHKPHHAELVLNAIRTGEDWVFAKRGLIYSLDQIAHPFELEDCTIRQSGSQNLVLYSGTPLCTFNSDGIGGLTDSTSVMTWSAPRTLTSIGQRYIPLGSPDLFQTVTGSLIVERSTFTTVASLPMSGGHNVVFYNMKQRTLVIYHLRERRYRRHEIVLIDRVEWERMIL